jgi:CheY-like chemotaxis protein
MTEPLESATVAPNNQFVAQIQKLLEHLHNYSYLLSHPLSELQSIRGHPGEGAGQEMRRLLLEAIESLSPGPGISFRAPHARVYNVLHLHYVEGMTVNEAAGELNISLRQAYRDLRRGEESVAAILWTKLEMFSLDEVTGKETLRTEETDERNRALEDEIKRMAPHTESLDIRTVIRRAFSAVDRLAQGHTISFMMVLPEDHVDVTTDGTVAQHLMVSLFSHAIQEAQMGQLVLTLTQPAGHVLMSLHYRLKENTIEWPDAAVTHLASRLSWMEPHIEDLGSERTLTLEIPIGGATILVVDDNAGLVELFERYLVGQPCHLAQAISAEAGVRLAQEVHPDAIILDVMMPEVDGWQVLQTLHANLQTAAIPVIICSVISDPQLADSLGASASLSKPVSRDDLLLVLRRLNLL